MVRPPSPQKKSCFPVAGDRQCRQSPPQYPNQEVPLEVPTGTFLYPLWQPPPPPPAPPPRPSKVEENATREMPSRDFPTNFPTNFQKVAPKPSAALFLDLGSPRKTEGPGQGPSRRAAGPGYGRTQAASATDLEQMDVVPSRGQHRRGAQPRRVRPDDGHSLAVLGGRVVQLGFVAGARVEEAGRPDGRGGRGCGGWVRGTDTSDGQGWGCGARGGGGGVE